MASTESFAGGREERLHAVIADYLDAVAAGRPDDRDRLLAEHPDLAAELREFFADRDRVGRLAGPVRTLAHPDPAPAPGGLPPGELGDFRIVRELGRGGMGVVYEAEQVSLGRRVALKVLPLAATMDPRQLQRFRHEARAAAMLHHGNIVPVYGVGCERGVHYYAMQMIEGRSLAAVIEGLRRERAAAGGGTPGTPAPAAPTASRSKRKSGPDRARFRHVAELVAQAADALEFAHSLGVVHRDVKPANLLLDAAGHLWVADFGLAKLDTAAALTVSGDLLGTLRYMSPEQALARHGLVDHRTDVYSLGATLYELLTLQPAVRGDDRHELLRRIAFEEPVAPRKLDRSIPAELETVTLKALAKNPNERYATAAEFAADLRHWLADRAIAAKPPSLPQRAGKWARRHTALVGSAAAALGVAAVALGVVAWQGERARRALSAEAQQTAAALATANKRLTQVERANEILGSVFRDLDPKQEEKEGKPLRALLGERLDKATAEVEGEAIGDPLAVARMQLTLGVSQLGLGYPDKAIRLFTAARATFAPQLGPDHPGTLASIANLAEGYRAAGRPGDALPLFEETFKLGKAKFGPDHPQTLLSMNNLGNGYRDAGKLDAALPLYEEAHKLCKAKLGPNHTETLRSMNNLGAGYRAAGRLDVALPLLEETFKLRKAKDGPDHPETLTSQSNLAEVYRGMGRLGDALPLFEEALERARAKLGPGHPDTLTIMNNLAVGYQAAGRLGDALPLFEEAVRLKKAKLGPDHPDTLNAMNNLGDGYRATGRHGDALPLLEEALKLHKAKLGPDHPRTLLTMNNLGNSYRAANRLSDALPLFEQTFELMKSKLGPDHPHSLLVMVNLASCYRDAGRLGDALPLYQESLTLTKAKLGLDHPNTIMSMVHLATGYRAAGRLDDAVPLFEEAARGVERRQYRDQHAGLFIGYAAACLEELRRFDAAEQWRRKWLAVVKERSGPNSAAYAADLAQLGLNLLRQQRWADAEPVLRECLTIREKAEPDAWATFATQSLLGDSLLGQQKHADAEPLLLAGFTGMKQRADKIPKDAKGRLADAAARLVRLYDALGKPDEAAKWLDEMWAAADAPAPAKP